MSRHGNTSPPQKSQSEIVNLAKAEEEAGVVDQQSVASAALVDDTTQGTDSSKDSPTPKRPSDTVPR